MDGSGDLDSVTIGSASVLSGPIGAEGNHSAVCYSANEGKCVGVYKQSSDNDCFAVVITPNGSDRSVAYGTPAEFEPTAGENLTVVDIGSSKVLICYGDDSNSGYPTSRVGTISGTDITFGDKDVIQSVQSSIGGFSASGKNRNLTWDSNTSRAVFMWRQNTTNKLMCAVGSNSGTDMTWGTPVEVHAPGLDGDKWNADATASLDPTVNGADQTYQHTTTDSAVCMFSQITIKYYLYTHCLSQQILIL